MASSSYYYGLMLDYSRSKRAQEEKLEQYKNYLTKLENLQSNLSGAYSHLVNSDSYLKQGYSIDGASLDNGDLGAACGLFSSAIGGLASVISKTAQRISEINDEVNKFQALYDTACANYNLAKRKESME